MSSATNQGTNSPKNESADPMGSANSKGQQGQGVPGNEQRSGEQSGGKTYGDGKVTDAAIAAADKSASLIPGAEGDRKATETGAKPQ